MIKVFGSKTGKEELEQVSESISNEWLGAGPKLKEFERKFSQRIHHDNFLMIDNASNGLYLALRLLDLPEGSEVIVPSFTWIACAHAIKMCKCIPVFCDVDYETQNITAQQIEPLITEKTKALIVVHYAGLPVDINPIKELGIPIIEDAAHAVDSIYQGKHCGTYGDFGIYSFDSMKNIAVGEGGGIVCSKQKDYDRAKQMRLCGMGSSSHSQSGLNKDRWWEQEASEIFIKMQPSDIMAGMGLAQLGKLSQMQVKRKQIWDIYQNELNIEELLLPADVIDFGTMRHSYFTFLIRTDRRDKLARFLYENNIYTTLRFYPIHLNKIYFDGKHLKNTEKLSETGLNIPLHPRLMEEEISKIIETIKQFFN